MKEHIKSIIDKTFKEVELQESKHYDNYPPTRRIYDELAQLWINSSKEKLQSIATQIGFPVNMISGTIPQDLKLEWAEKFLQALKATPTINEAEQTDTATKADATFKTLEAVLLDLRNAESKLVMGISYDMQNLFGGDLNAIKGVIENASASLENLAKKMHQQLLQERINNPNQSSANKFGDWFSQIEK